MRLLSVLLLAAAVGCATPPNPLTNPPAERPNEPLDLDEAEDNLHAFQKSRGSLDADEDVVFYWTGTIYLAQDVEPLGSPLNDFPGPILRFEGFNIARFVPATDGVRMISREIALYQDMQGSVIDCWNNARLGTDDPGMVPVVHVQNDPVNWTLGGGEYEELGDRIIWKTEMQLAYPSSMPVDGYPEYSASNTYQSLEMFNFFASRADLEDPTLDSAPVTLSWSRVGQLLPWMRPGQSTDKLVYHTHGAKLLGGFDELPETLRTWVATHAPEYATAPDSDDAPNITSWRFFKGLLDTGEYSPTCD